MPYGDPHMNMAESLSAAVRSEQRSLESQRNHKVYYESELPPSKKPTAEDRRRWLAEHNKRYMDAAIYSFESKLKSGDQHRILEPGRSLIVPAIEKFHLKQVIEKPLYAKHQLFIEEYGFSLIKKEFPDWETLSQENVPETVLRRHYVKEWSSDFRIIAELGGEEVAETTFAQMFYLINNQEFGYGPLLTNFKPNVFYIRNCDEQLCEVRCYRRGEGYCFPWYIHAGKLELDDDYYQTGPGEGCQIFSK